MRKPKATPIVQVLLYLVTVIIVVLDVACSTSQTQSGTSSNTLGRIGIRKNLDGFSEFYNKTNGKSFVPQGVNWVHLSKSGDKKAENISFNEEFFKSHRADIQLTLQEIARSGFNVVRVRVDGKAISGSKEKLELNRSYVANLTSFIQTANLQGLYVLLTGQWLPENYYQIVYNGSHPLPSKNVSGLNLMLMSQGATAAFSKYESDLLKEIRSISPISINGIFSIDLWNELHFNGNEKPFSESKGEFLSETGLTFNLAIPESRQALADETELRWVNSVVGEIKNTDPEILVTSSVFSAKEVHRTGYHGVRTEDSTWKDWRQPFRLKVLAESNLDYLQIHPYPHTLDYNLDDDLNSMEFSQLQRNKPILIGEFGAFKKEFKNVNDALQILKTFLSQACRKKITGWIYWTWDTYEQVDLWNMKDSNSEIEKGLSPIHYNWCEGIK